MAEGGQYNSCMLPIGTEQLAAAGLLLVVLLLLDVAVRGRDGYPSGAIM